MKRIVFEIVLGCLVVFLVLANLGLHDTVQKSKQSVIQWQEEYERLHVKIQEREAIQPLPSKDLLTLQQQLDACRKKKHHILKEQEPLSFQDDILSLSPDILRQYRNEYRKNKKNMTSLQLKTWQQQEADALKGKQIAAQGYVTEVREKGLLTPFSLFLETDNQDDLSTSEIVLLLDPKDDRDFALSAQKGDFLTFTGTVKSLSYTREVILLLVQDVQIQ